jgi:hypothetical protein
VTYFDHVRCSACKAMLDPESLANKPGQGLSCPRCGAPLALGDLFGLKDAFAEEDQEDLSLDDVLSKMRAPTASVAPPSTPPGRASAPPPRAAAAPGKPAARPAAPAAAAKAAPRQLPGPAPAAKAAPRPAAPAAKAAPRPVPSRPLPSQPAAPAAPAADDASAALEAMRALRKKK